MSDTKAIFMAVLAGALMGFIFGLPVVGYHGKLADRIPISPRAVDHVYGATVSIESPGLTSVYLRWCDPTGYLVFASSLEKEATLTVVRDSRCDGVGR